MEEPTNQRSRGAELLFCFDIGPPPTTLKSAIGQLLVLLGSEYRSASRPGTNHNPTAEMN